MQLGQKPDGHIDPGGDPSCGGHMAIGDPAFIAHDLLIGHQSFQFFHRHPMGRDALTDR